MKSFSNKVKITLLKGMEALGTTASNLASNAKLKVNEINLETRRREILTDFSLQAFELWQKGVQLPETLSNMLTELSDIEDRLSVLRAQKYAKVNSAETAPAADEAAPPAEEATGMPNEEYDATETSELAQEVESALGVDPEAMPMQENATQAAAPLEENAENRNE